MEDPHPLGQYLGVSHRIQATGPLGRQLTEVESDMVDLFKSKVMAYQSDIGCTFHAPKVDNATFERNLDIAGALDAKQCASHLMGRLYGARMARPGVSVAITGFASRITTWNKECDRRLEHLFSYLRSSEDVVPPGSLSEVDLPDMVLRFLLDADLNGDEFHTKSTYGCWVELAGQDGRAFPLACSPRNKRAQLVQPLKPKLSQWPWEHVKR